MTLQTIYPLTCYSSGHLRILRVLSPNPRPMCGNSWKPPVKSICFSKHVMVCARSSGIMRWKRHRGANKKCRRKCRELFDAIVLGDDSAITFFGWFNILWWNSMTLDFWIILHFADKTGWLITFITVSGILCQELLRQCVRDENAKYDAGLHWCWRRGNRHGNQGLRLMCRGFDKMKRSMFVTCSSI